MPHTTFQSQRAGDTSASAGETAQGLSIRRIGWAVYVITTEAGTKVLVDLYLNGGKGAGEIVAKIQPHWWACSEIATGMACHELVKKQASVSNNDG